MKVGELIHDYALGMNGIVVDGPWLEPRGSDSEAAHDSHTDIIWEWLVLYDDGELQGADSVDLREIPHAAR
ncbi:MAG TPA: hypothetical protein EYQ00_12140 [Dehalococcoidia bacterium]|nr:hypothetical protein [Dehalococcoidia bacterium]